MFNVRVAVLTALFSAHVLALRVDPAKAQHAAHLHASNVSTVSPTQADIDQLHKRLEITAGGLESSLTAQEGAFGQTKVGKEVAIFAKELEAVLAETRGKAGNPAETMRKLEAAKAGVAGLSGDLSSRQEELMKEDEAQKDSLLLGVLMTKQKEPMAKQLEILQSQDFAELPVSKALLAKHDDSGALFQQAGEYLDQHSKKAARAATAAKAAEPGAKEAATKVAAAAIEQRVKTLEGVYEARVSEHKRHTKELELKAKEAPKASKHKLDLMLRRENRDFDKAAAAQRHDIDTLKSALGAIKQGDMKAVGVAMASLEQSIKNLQAKNGGFLVFLELGTGLVGSDCPFCAAQCVNTCHEAGKPYTRCLTECADAGKGK